MMKMAKFTTSFYVPYIVYSLRTIQWDEWLLKRIEDYQKIKSRYNMVTGTEKARKFIGGKFIIKINHQKTGNKFTRNLKIFSSSNLF